MIIFYRVPSDSPNMRKISLMLEETALPYVVKVVEPSNSEARDADFDRISPNGTAPAILDTDTGTALFESGAILHYLAEKSGKLLPAHSVARAEAMKWLMFEVANVCPTMVELHHYVMNDAGEFPDAIFQRYKRRLAKFCAILDQQLAGREHLAGEYSIADIALYPWMVTLEDFADIQLSDYPHLSRWAQAIGNRPATLAVANANITNTNWCYRKGGVEICSA